MTPLRHILETVKKTFSEEFRENLSAVILYGSFAKGAAQTDSDIDLLAIFENLNAGIESAALKMMRGIEQARSVSLVTACRDDFEKETEPLYTAVKREGRIVCGSVALTVAPGPPEIKYAVFFEKSAECETSKIRIAEEILVSGRSSGVIDLCFIASKHALQAALAMYGEGYSSKIAVLLPLTEKYFGPDIAESFKKLNELYVKTEYRLIPLAYDEAVTAPERAKKILKVYRMFQQ